ncbi:MAG TPA: M23 family metallopeptidase [Candidatus Bathyarchaeia archaeon]|nr:M23 family metallopeptidase [Candidatus Bathyarchaeia archaeon]
MKKWTVLLIPHDRTSARTLSICAYQLWALAALLVALSFTSTFFFSRHEAAVRYAEARLRLLQSELEGARTAQPAADAQGKMSPRERVEIESRIRAEYEASIAAITAELNDLHDMEAQARSLTGLAPRSATKDSTPLMFTGGKGGADGGIGETVEAAISQSINPPGVIYGVSRPSADMLIQEINLRTASLGALVAELKARESRIARLPSIWPALVKRRGISSPYGYRKDPFTLRVRHHDGADISAPTGTPVVATADGKVSFAGYDGDYGKIVRISHGNGMETCYGHLQSYSVTPGQAIKRGDVIGKCGRTGRTTGAHIHYEVRINGKTVNPSKYFSRN